MLTTHTSPVPHAARLDELLSASMLRTTPYLPAHLEAGAVFAAKGGWLRPSHFGDPVAEQLACREAVALFDVHSMGKITITGTEADVLIERVTANKPPSEVGGAVYTTLCNRAGRMIDDAVIYRCTDEWFVMCGTVSRRVVAEHLRSCGRGLQVTVRDVTAERAYMALQGPRAWDVLSLWLDGRRADVQRLRYYNCVELDMTDHHSGLDWCLVCRTGYTGELGFELIVPIDQALSVWQSLREVGRPSGLVPAGAAALQALRTEKGYRGFGADIDRTMTPAEAGLGWTVRVAGRSVVGQEVLEQQSGSPADHCRVWPVMTGADIPVGARVMRADSDEVVGQITSSAHSPTLDRHVGIARFAIPGWPGEAPLFVGLDGVASHSITVGRGGFLDPKRARLTVELH
jgi:glycine cleavage system T protein (aminomethyltransferase)